MSLKARDRSVTIGKGGTAILSLPLRLTVSGGTE